VITLDSLSKTWGKAGLGPISTRIHEGEWVTLLGPSGCGKTTLLKLIAGLETKSSGQIDSPYRRDEISYVFQEPALLPWLSAAENIALPLTLKGVSIKEAMTKAEPWIEKLKIGNFLKHHPAELSGGLKMRVSFARALIKSPKLLLLDEPFAALDEPIRIELGMELRELWKTLNPTILMVTHSITEGLWLSDRALIFQGQPGRVILDTPMDLGRDRPLSLRGDPRFLKRVEDCFELLKGGVK
jgi:NitT/TauT family transport system ATP-binding protein